MIWMFGLSDFPADSIVHMAIATSLATIILTSISSVLAHRRIGTLQWSAVLLIAPYMFVGAILGSVIAGQVIWRIAENHLRCLSNHRSATHVVAKHIS